MNTTFTFSIDDGHPSDLKMAELLSKNCLNGTFFIPIKNREGFPVLCKSDIRDIGDQFEIGSHTYDHSYLIDTNVTEAFHQISDGKKQLEDLLGREAVGFCYPGGKYRQEHVDIVKSAGFRYARTTMNLCFDAGDNPFEMQTTFQFYPHHRSVYLRNFVIGGNWLNRFDGLKLAVKNDNWIERLYALFEHSCQCQLEFHLWGHSKDIDEINAWCELDQFFSYVATKIPIKNRLNNEQLSSRFFTT